MCRLTTSRPELHLRKAAIVFVGCVHILWFTVKMFLTMHFFKAMETKILKLICYLYDHTQQCVLDRSENEINLILISIWSCRGVGKTSSSRITAVWISFVCQWRERGGVAAGVQGDRTWTRLPGLEAALPLSIPDFRRTGVKRPSHRWRSALPRCPFGQVLQTFFLLHIWFQKKSSFLGKSLS